MPGVFCVTDIVVLGSIMASACVDSVVALGSLSVAIFLSLIFVAASPLRVAVDLVVILSPSPVAIGCGGEMVVYGGVLFCVMAVIVVVGNGLQLSVIIDKTVVVMILINGL